MQFNLAYYDKPKSRNMAEAVTLSVIQELDSWLKKLPATYEDMREDMEDLRQELKMILDLVRDVKKLRM